MVYDTLVIESTLFFSTSGISEKCIRAAGTNVNLWLKDRSGYNDFILITS